jgi:rubrerythrin
MTVSRLILTYVIGMLCALTGVMIYSEFRQRHFKPTPSNDRIFRCAKCGYVYTDDPDVDRSRCSQCGQSNEAIEF